MKERKRLIAALICIVMVVFVIAAGITHVPKEEEDHEYKDSIILWYVDDSMTDYLNAMAVEYHEKGGMRVLPKLCSSSEYIENIYSTSIEGEGTPDLYIISNDALQKAYLSGCALAVDDEGTVLNADNYPMPALNSVTYNGHRVAYPYYFETSALIYNKTYMHDMIANKIMAERVTEPEEGTEETDDATDLQAMDEDELARLIDETMEESIPDTFDDLLSFADSYDAPEGVETIFKWDVRDLFFNYFFIGNYIDIGGPFGDDEKRIDIYNQDAINALGLFQSLNGFFAFESSDVTYDQVIEEFIEGKLVFATATSEVIMRLEEAKAAGDFPYEYGVAKIPDLSEEMASRSLSVTETIVVNGYGNKLKEANDFAQYLSFRHAGDLYDRTGKVPSRSNAVDTYKEGHNGIEAFVAEYEASAPMPKLMTTSNYWLLLEDTFAGVWSGDDPSRRLKQLYEQLMYQITGTEVSVDYIEPVKVEEEVEYLDEEALKVEAQGGEGNTEE